MAIYDEIEIEDMNYDEQSQTFTYNCPCGDMFRITLEMLKSGENIAECPSCPLRICVIFEPSDLQVFASMSGDVMVC